MSPVLAFGGGKIAGRQQLVLCRHARKPNYSKLVPLVYAPALPLCASRDRETAYKISVMYAAARAEHEIRSFLAVRLALDKRVTSGTRDKIFAAAVLTALFHAGYVMSSDSTMGAGN